MKLYTNQTSQFAKELLLLNETVKFDRFGVAELEDEIGKKIVKTYPDWYSDKKFEYKEDTVKIEQSKESDDKDKEIVFLKQEVARGKRIDEDRINTIKMKDEEIAELRKTLGEVVIEKEKIELDIQNKEDFWKKEKEVYETKIQLVDMTSNELQQTALSLNIDEKSLKGLKKPELVELIVKKTHNLE